MKQVMAHELVDLSRAQTVGGPHHAPLMIHPVVCITPLMRDRLVATIRHLRAVIRRQRDTARPYIILGDTHYGELHERKHP